MAEFQLHFTDNILKLHRELENRTYRHGGYQAFKINDPKPRDIHKATVRDRLVHHAVYRILYPYFNKFFIHDSYSCRIGKGTHRAVNRFRDFSRQVSKNNTKTAWVLKGDVKKFFASIDHQILKNILAEKLRDKKALWLLSQIIDSFNTKDKTATGLPLGNLTSQLLVNIYLNKFDQFIKRELRIKFYIRYADDFVILHENRRYLTMIIPKISGFLEKKLNLSLHRDKLSVKTLYSGLDFLGYVNFPCHRVLRTKTKRRIFKLANYKNMPSYLGVLKHANSYKLTQALVCQCLFNLKVF